MSQDAEAPPLHPDDRDALLAWYRANQRPLPWRRTRDPYAIWVSELMCQQTRVDTVIPYYHRWMARFPDIQSLAESPIEDLLLLWQGLGYYRRARHLHAGAQQVMREHGGQMPPRHALLLKLPGIGPYTAGAIASIAFGAHTPAVDGNVLRVLSRVLEETRPINKRPAQRAIEAYAQRFADGESPGEANQALMELGATLCTPTNPACDACPLQRICRAHASGTADALPVKDAKRPPRIEHAHAWLLTRPTAQRFLLAQRRDDALLGGLWELPLLPSPPEGDGWTQLGDIRHIFSHIDLRVALWRHDEGADAPELPSLYQRSAWVHASELARYPLSTLARKLLESPPA